MLGAEAVQVGTRFVVAKESNAHQNFKDKILKAKDIDTVISASVVGHPVRSLKNKLTTSYAHAEKISWLVRKLKKISKFWEQVHCVMLLLTVML